MLSLPLLPLIEGFGFNFLFVFSFGPQNALLLIEGARGGKILTIGATCFVFEAVLLSSTASGLLFFKPELVSWLRWAGLGFLLWCGLRAARAAFFSCNKDIIVSNWSTPFVAALVVSVANPLLWLETVLLTGGVALQFSGPDRAACVGGALLATGLRIFGISYGVRLTDRRLRSAMLTSAANAVIAFVMLGYAAVLLWSLVQPIPQDF